VFAPLLLSPSFLFPVLTVSVLVLPSVLLLSGFIPLLDVEYIGRSKRHTQLKTIFEMQTSQRTYYLNVCLPLIARGVMGLAGLVVGVSVYVCVSV
jgi:hypothetical protein